MSENQTPPADIKILLVDDEVNITRALLRLFNDVEHYQVLTANSGQDALLLLRENQDCGVIISDQRMPGMTGVEFLRQARDISPEAVRLLLTGYADIEASIAAINRGGIFRYLTKPWDDDALLQAVAEAAANFTLIQENKRLNALVRKQKDELAEWNKRLKQRVLDQTSQIRAKSDELAESHSRLKESFSAIIEALAGLIELHHKRAPGHSRNVSELLKVMARRLKLDDLQQKKIVSAGLLHDIGKIGINDRILAKAADEMTAQEYKEYKTHVIRGQAAIDRVPELRDIGEMVRHHHERFDGKGFPDGLKGESIPLGSRMICAANLFEHKLLKYPQSEALDEALADLKGEWGPVLDPALRTALEEGAREIYASLNLVSEVTAKMVSPKELKPGMQLKADLYSGTGVLLLKKGSVFDENSIDATRRCFKIDPFERDICVIIREKPADEE